MTERSLAARWAFTRRFPDGCCAEVSRKGQSQPCDKPAFAVVEDSEEGDPWPVCIHHARGRNLVPLAEVLRAQAELVRPHRGSL